MKRSGRKKSKSRPEIREGAAEKLDYDWGDSRGRQRDELLRGIRSGQGRANGKNRDFAGPFSMTRHWAGRVVSRRILFAALRHGGTALMGRGEIRLTHLHLRGSAAHRFTAQVASEGEPWQSSQDQRERDDNPASALHDRRRQPEGRSVHSLIERRLRGDPLRRPGRSRIRFPLAARVTLQQAC